MDSLGNEYDETRKWPLKQIEEKGWELKGIERVTRKYAHQYAIEKKAFEKMVNGEIRTFYYTTRKGVINHDIVYTWQKGDRVCCHVQTFNPILILN